MEYDQRPADGVLCGHAFRSLASCFVYVIDHYYSYLPLINHENLLDELEMPDCLCRL